MSPMQIAYLATMIAFAIFAPLAQANPTEAQRFAFEQSLIGIDANGDGDYLDAGVDANADGDYLDVGDTKPDVQGVLAIAYEAGQPVNSPAGRAYNNLANTWQLKVWVTTSADGLQVARTSLVYTYIAGAFRTADQPQCYAPPVDPLIAGAEELDAAVAYSVELDIRGRSGAAATPTAWESAGFDDGIPIVAFTFADGSTGTYLVRKRNNGTFYFSRRK